MVTPACGLVRGHRGAGSLFPSRGRELHPHVKQFRRFRVRHILASICITYVSRQLVAPQSHGGLSSEGKLNSWSNSAPQRTGPTPHCPALGNFPELGLQPHQRTSGELQSLGCALAVFVPFATAATLLSWSSAASISPRALWGWVQAAGQRAMEQLQEQLQAVAQGQLPTEEPLAAELAAAP